MAVFRVLLGFASAMIVAALLASIFHSQFVIAALADAGAELSWDLRIAMTMNDLAGLGPQFGAVIAIGFAIGFPVAAVLKRVLKFLAPIAYPLAGAAAVAVALVIMGLAFGGITPIAGARTDLGFGLLSLAGAIGGVVFSVFAARPR